MFISNVASLLNLASNEKIAYGLIAKLELGRTVENNFHSIISHMVKVAKFKRGFTGDRAELIQALKKKEVELEKILDNFKDTRQDYEGFEQPLNEQEMDRNFEIITKELKEIKILIKEIIVESKKRGVIVNKPSPLKGTMSSKKRGQPEPKPATDQSSGYVSNSPQRSVPLKVPSQVPVQKTANPTDKKRPSVREETPMWMKEHQNSIADF